MPFAITNAFALIYRPGAQTACEDLARAVAFIHDHADELQVDVSDYSLWGGSAGARMAAWVGSYGTAAWIWTGRRDCGGRLVCHIIIFSLSKAVFYGKAEWQSAVRRRIRRLR